MLLTCHRSSLSTYDTDNRARKVAGTSHKLSILRSEELSLEEAKQPRTDCTGTSIVLGGNVYDSVYRDSTVPPAPIAIQTVQSVPSCKAVLMMLSIYSISKQDTGPRERDT
jgi:hypothetical protein